MNTSIYRDVLGYFNSSTGVNPIVQKLPYHLQNKWTQRAMKHMRENAVPFPPFSVFCQFVHEMSSVLNNPSFMYEDKAPMNARHSLDTDQNRNVRHGIDPALKGSFTPRGAYRKVAVNKTGISQSTEFPKEKVCPVHGTSHSLNDCRAFKAKRLDERKRLIKDFGICFKCCESTEHRARDCKTFQKCLECKSEGHPTALHVAQTVQGKAVNWSQQASNYGGEKREDRSNTHVDNKCTQICGSSFPGKSCAKMVLVNVYHKAKPEKSIKAYAIIDDQSNRTLARSDLFQTLELKGDIVEYVLNSCSGSKVSSGRTADGCVEEALNGGQTYEIPSMLECDNIPNVREEIPTLEVAAHHPHLRDIASDIPPVDEEADILLLIGRDLIDVHYVADQRCGGPNKPYAQKLGLGWVIIGEACLGGIHRSSSVNVNKIHLLQNGRPSLFCPCHNGFDVSEEPDIRFTPENTAPDPLFKTSKDDEKPGLSIDDRDFLQTMEYGFRKDSYGKWTAPLPFRPDRERLPNNKAQAEKRARTLDRNLQTNKNKRKLFLEFMEKILENGHAERAPNLDLDQECWYLPIFGVFHPQKPDQIRCVFDSSARHNGISLNDVLLTGPDLTNNLLGVLLRFRREEIAVMGDIQQMFYSFYVQENHRDFLRFLWYENNDPERPMFEYRMCVHVFGNSPSPAVATYGLRKTIEGSDHDVREFVTKDFYVDDGLTSKPTPSEAISLMQRTKTALESGGLR